MAMPPQPAAQPLAGGDPAQEDDASGGYTIEVKVAGDGSISVCVEPEMGEMGEESSAEDAGEEDYQPVASIREACKLVTQIYQSQGQLPDSTADQADMATGYGKD